MTGPVQCGNCGQRWPYHPALDVECPKCHAAKGTHCKKPSGHTFWRHELPHVEREQVAVDTGAMPCECPASTKRATQPNLFGGAP